MGDSDRARRLLLFLCSNKRGWLKSFGRPLDLRSKVVMQYYTETTPAFESLHPIPSLSCRNVTISHQAHRKPPKTEQKKDERQKEIAKKNKSKKKNHQLTC